MKLKITPSLIFFLICSQLLAQSEPTFPESWDKNRNLRKTDSQVLAWTHKLDTTRSYEYKSCIVLLVGKDSLGEKEYFISQMYTNEEPFGEWNYSSIHYGPNGTQMSGFHDLHLERFTYKPSKKEIYKLLSRWKCKLKENGWIIIECGLDEDLWMQYFDFKPTKKELTNYID